MKSSDIVKLKQWLGSGCINIFGMPFAGKDTQANRLADMFDAPVISSGQILREGDIPPHVRTIMDRGELIPTEDFLRIIPPFLSRSELASKPLILSSIGRWDGEQEAVLRATIDAGHPTKAVVFLTIDEDDARQRSGASDSTLNRGVRADDDPAAFATRMDEFRIKTLPVMEFYRSKGLLVEVDGSRTKDEVTNEIVAKLLTLAGGN